MDNKNQGTCPITPRSLNQTYQPQASNYEQFERTGQPDQNNQPPLDSGNRDQSQDPWEFYANQAMNPVQNTGNGSQQSTYTNQRPETTYQEQFGSQRSTYTNQRPETTYQEQFGSQRVTPSVHRRHDQRSNSFSNDVDMSTHNHGNGALYRASSVRQSSSSSRSEIQLLGMSMEKVGLYNGGATCYMNSVLQQLCHAPKLHQALCDMTFREKEKQRALVKALQNVFEQLTSPVGSVYAPKEFWRVFKMFEQPIVLSEQQDAFEFFTELTQQVYESLKRTGADYKFVDALQGVTVTNLRFHCTHRHSIKEDFFSISLPLTAPNLEKSLENFFIQEQILDGEDAFTCPHCYREMPSIKTMCIRRMPPVMVVHLKRFEYSWKHQMTLKHNDFLEFPMDIDMTKFMETPKTPEGKNWPKYKLVGIVVHTGEATSGHYYSYIRDRSSKEKWVKFNDSSVSQVYWMDRSLLERECFGSIRKTYRYSHQYQATNAYILFYEAAEEKENRHEPIKDVYRNEEYQKYAVGAQQTALSSRNEEYKKYTVGAQQTTSSLRTIQDPHSPKDVESAAGSAQADESSRTGQVKKIPASIFTGIETDMKDLTGKNNFKYIFARRVVAELKNINCRFLPELERKTENKEIQCMRLALVLLPNIYNSEKWSDWCRFIRKLAEESEVSCKWAIQNIQNLKFQIIPEWTDIDMELSNIGIKSLLFHQEKHVRTMTAWAMASIMNAYWRFAANQKSKKYTGLMDKMLTFLISMLNADFSQKEEFCDQYFKLLDRCMAINEQTDHIQQIIGNGGFEKFKDFLRGKFNHEGKVDAQSKVPVAVFEKVHVMFAAMITHCLQVMAEKRSSASVGKKNQQKIPDEAIRFICTGRTDAQPESEFSLYIRRVLQFANLGQFHHMLRMSVLSDNERSSVIITSILDTLYGIPEKDANEKVKGLIYTLHELLNTSDGFKQMRIKLAIKGLFAIIDTIQYESEESDKKVAVVFAIVEAMKTEQDSWLQLAEQIHQRPQMKGYLNVPEYGVTTRL